MCSAQGGEGLPRATPNAAVMDRLLEVMGPNVLNRVSCSARVGLR